MSSRASRGARLARRTGRSRPTTASIAFSRFASGKTMTGALPPASSETRLNVRAPSSISRRPTSLLPVKLILSTRGSVASASPTTPPSPTTPLATPCGSAGIRSSSPKIAIDDAGASLAGFRTNVQPVAIAAPILRSGRSTGSFHGVIRRADADRLLEDEVQEVARRRGRSPRRGSSGRRWRRTGCGRSPARSRARGRTGSACPSRSRRGATAARPPRAGAGRARSRMAARSRPACRRPRPVVERRPGGCDRPAPRPRRRTAARPRRGRRSPDRGSRAWSPDAAGDHAPSM